MRAWSPAPALRISAIMSDAWTRTRLSEAHAVLDQDCAGLAAPIAIVEMVPAVNSQLQAHYWRAWLHKIHVK
jgi:hypothetical protein